MPAAAVPGRRAVEPHRFDMSDILRGTGRANAAEALLLLKGMPMLAEGEELYFLRRQVLTSRNVRGIRLVDFLLGGLNYQIEHHLFPNMPRPNLRQAQPLVRAFCQEHDLSYSEASMFGSYAEAVRHLHTIGAPLRPTRAVADH